MSMFDDSDPTHELEMNQRARLHNLRVENQRLAAERDSLAERLALVVKFWDDNFDEAEIRALFNPPTAQAWVDILAALAAPPTTPVCECHLQGWPQMLDVGSGSTPMHCPRCNKPYPKFKPSAPAAMPKCAYCGKDVVSIKGCDCRKPSAPAHKCDTCAAEFATCGAKRIVFGIDRDPSARGAEADKVLECDQYKPSAPAAWCECSALARLEAESIGPDGICCLCGKPSAPAKSEG